MAPTNIKKAKSKKTVAKRSYKDEHSVGRRSSSSNVVTYNVEMSLSSNLCTQRQSQFSEPKVVTKKSPVKTPSVINNKKMKESDKEKHGRHSLPCRIKREASLNASAKMTALLTADVKPASEKLIETDFSAPTDVAGSPKTISHSVPKEAEKQLKTSDKKMNSSPRPISTPRMARLNAAAFINVYSTDITEKPNKNVLKNAGEISAIPKSPAHKKESNSLQRGNKVAANINAVRNETKDDQSILNKRKSAENELGASSSRARNSLPPKKRKSLTTMEPPTVASLQPNVVSSSQAPVAVGTHILNPPRNSTPTSILSSSNFNFTSSTLNNNGFGLTFGNQLLAFPSVVLRPFEPYFVKPNYVYGQAVAPSFNNVATLSTNQINLPLIISEPANNLHTPKLLSLQNTSPKPAMRKSSSSSKKTSKANEVSHSNDDSITALESAVVDQCFTSTPRRQHSTSILSSNIDSEQDVSIDIVNPVENNQLVKNAPSNWVWNSPPLCEKMNCRYFAKAVHSVNGLTFGLGSFVILNTSPSDGNGYKSKVAQVIDLFADAKGGEYLHVRWCYFASKDFCSQNNIPLNSLFQSVCVDENCYELDAVQSLAVVTMGQNVLHLIQENPIACDEMSEKHNLIGYFFEKVNYYCIMKFLPAPVDAPQMEDETPGASDSIRMEPTTDRNSINADDSLLDRWAGMPPSSKVVPSCVNTTVVSEFQPTNDTSINWAEHGKQIACCLQINHIEPEGNGNNGSLIGETSFKQLTSL